MNRENKLILCSILNKIINKADPELEEYDEICIGIDNEDNFLVQTGGDLSDSQEEIKSHLLWLLELLEWEYDSINNYNDNRIENEI